MRAVIQYDHNENDDDSTTVQSISDVKSSYAKLHASVFEKFNLRDRDFFMLLVDPMSKEKTILTEENYDVLKTRCVLPKILI